MNNPLRGAPKRTAVVLFNLGGPDSLISVKPFLFNLFNDPAIIGAPGLIRYLLAKFIAWKRAPYARAVYEKMGGGSTILPRTEAQALSLEKALKREGEFKVFTCMRYWRPRAQDVVRKVKEYEPDRVILLPLYPQYSTTTTASSLKEWREESEKAGLYAPTSGICCYYNSPHFIAAHMQLLREAYFKASEHGTPRVLFSAHGLPQKVIDKGDPYQWQVDQTVESIVKTMAFDQMDYRICYQSRVGPLKWIGPSAEEEIIRAAQEKKPIIIVPVSFVSEHSETLVELDIVYKELAEHYGAPAYIRVPALGTEPQFIECLLHLVTAGRVIEGIVPAGNRGCTESFSACGMTSEVNHGNSESLSVA